MSLQIYTARVSYRSADRLDITAQGKDPFGSAFAPSWGLLTPHIRRRHARQPEDWEGYVAGYTNEMRQSYRSRRPAWDKLLAMPEVTLVCYCYIFGLDGHCHRLVLAGLLGKLGAVYLGERTAAKAVVR